MANENVVAAGIGTLATEQMDTVEEAERTSNAECKEQVEESDVDESDGENLETTITANDFTTAIALQSEQQNMSKKLNTKS